jgi:hypothetical protein
MGGHDLSCPVMFERDVRKDTLKKESKNIYRDVRNAFERDWKVIRE